MLTGHGEPILTRPLYVPDRLPKLVAGTGGNPGIAGCVMQYINLLKTDHWSDHHPEAVPTQLRNLLIRINDTLCTPHRQELWYLVPRIFDTGRFRPVAGLGSLVQRALDAVHTAVRLSEHDVKLHGCSTSLCTELLLTLEKTLTEFDVIVGRDIGSVADVPWGRVAPERLRELAMTRPVFSSEASPQAWVDYQEAMTDQVDLFIMVAEKMRMSLINIAKAVSELPVMRQRALPHEIHWHTAMSTSADGSRVFLTREPSAVAVSRSPKAATDGLDGDELICHDVSGELQLVG